MTDDTQLDAIRARTQALTPDVSPYVTAQGGVVILSGPYHIEKANAIRDAVVAAATDVPWLLEQVDTLAVRLLELYNASRPIEDAIGVAETEAHERFFEATGAAYLALNRLGVRTVIDGEKGE